MSSESKTSSESNNESKTESKVCPRCHILLDIKEHFEKNGKIRKMCVACRAYTNAKNKPHFTLFDDLVVECECKMKFRNSQLFKHLQSDIHKFRMKIIELIKVEPELNRKATTNQFIERFKDLVPIESSEESKTPDSADEKECKD